MRAFIFKIGFAFVILTFMLSCGTSTIVVNNANVEIYANNEYKGKGTAEIKRTGFPQKTNLEAKYEGKTVGQLVIKRKPNTGAIVLSCLAGGIGIPILLFTFHYSDMITIPIDYIEQPGNKKVNKESIWNKPPSTWK